MVKHECPDCRCEEQPQCANGHCMHRGGTTWPIYRSRCCRCPFTESYEAREDMQNSSSWPPPDCKLYENVVIT